MEKASGTLQLSCLAESRGMGDSGAPTQGAKKPPKANDTQRNFMVFACFSKVLKPFFAKFLWVSIPLGVFLVPEFWEASHLGEGEGASGR